MRKQIVWSTILSDNEEAIIDAIIKAYRDACGSQANSGWQECVDITEDGTISTYTISQNSTSGDVWNGEAFEIARINWFDPMDGVDSSDIIDFLRSENKLEDWVKYLATEGHIDELDDNSDIEHEARNATYYIYTVEEWNHELWKEYQKELEDGIVEEFASNQADTIFAKSIKHAKENESYYEENDSLGKS